LASATRKALSDPVVESLARAGPRHESGENLKESLSGWVIAKLNRQKWTLYGQEM